MRISDWSSDVCSSDLRHPALPAGGGAGTSAGPQGRKDFIMTKIDNWLDDGVLPTGFADEAALEEFMTRPSRALAPDLAALDGDIMIPGVGGKMGPTMPRLAKRASPDKRVLGVARFRQQRLKEDIGRH